jgi:hypothetical protein
VTFEEVLKSMKQEPLQESIVARNCRKAMRLLVAFAVCVAYLGAASAQLVSSKRKNILDSNDSTAARREAPRTEPLQEVFRTTPLRLHPLDEKGLVRNNIIIGFVGGFVKRNDLKHPEVQFAALLRKSYPPSVHAEVFANHDGEEALRRVLQLLDSNGDGVITGDEKEQANIIIYGHSWGASQTVTLARALGRQGVPVLLTIQVDSVRKPGQEDSIIPPNVRNAVNFYQTRGLIHGRSSIRAADPERTQIVGNYRMSYRDRRVNCDNYPWLARHFNKPHHEIENDPNVWNHIASVIDLELMKTTPIVGSSLPSASKP